MSFKYFPIYNQSENFNKIINHNAINFFLSTCGGYIAGGLSEKENKGIDIKDYLRAEKGTYSGDIDIYFETKEGFKKAIDYAHLMSHTTSGPQDDYPTHNLSDYSCFIKSINTWGTGKFNKLSYDRNKHIRHIEKSCTDISYQAYIDIEFTNSLHDAPIKVQLIGSDFIGSMEEIMNTFDFANVQIAYYLKNNQLFCCKKDIEIEKNMLEIVNSHSPLMIHRINKYLKHRGYKGITDSSKHHIVDWLIKARAGYFKNPVLGITLWQDALNNKEIRRAIFERTIPDDALLLIIGKVITERKVYRGYRRYDYVQIDEALEAIKERNNS